MASQDQLKLSWRGEDSQDPRGKTLSLHASHFLSIYPYIHLSVYLNNSYAPHAKKLPVLYILFNLFSFSAPLSFSLSLSHINLFQPQHYVKSCKITQQRKNQYIIIHYNGMKCAILPAERQVWCLGGRRVSGGGVVKLFHVSARLLFLLFFPPFYVHAKPSPVFQREA